MPLTTRTNGSGGSNIIQSDWFNDFLKLFTGVMTDQPVQFTNLLLLKGNTFTLTAPTLALTTGSALGIGNYTYGISFQNGLNGETKPGPTATLATTSGNQAINLSSIPTGPAGTTARRVYRSKVGTSSPLFLVTTIADNSTTTYADTTADASLVTQSQAHNSFGGALVVQDNTGTTNAQVFSDGAAWLDVGAITSNGLGVLTLLGLINNNAPIVVTGTTAGTASLYTVILGSVKFYYLVYAGYENTTATEQKISLPQAITTRAAFLALGGNQITHFFSGGSQLTSKCSIITALPSGSGAGTPSTQSAVNGFSTGEITAGFDQIGLSVSDSQVLSGSIIFVGV